MNNYLALLCRFAPYLALAFLGVFQVIDQTTMIVLTIVLLTAGLSARPACRAKRA